MRKFQFNIEIGALPGEKGIEYSLLAPEQKKYAGIIIIV